LKNNLLKYFIPTTLFFLGIIILLSELSNLICFVFPTLKADHAEFLQYGIAISLLCFVIIPAFFEEFVFRKLILRFLQKHCSNLIAVLLSSFLFAVFHLNILQGIIAFVFGIFLAITAIKTRSVILCIYAHLLNNFLFVFSKNFIIIRGFNDNLADFQPFLFNILGLVLISTAILLYKLFVKTAK
jgi:membrane protease YdiL (CAAX protease family)